MKYLKLFVFMLVLHYQKGSVEFVVLFFCFFSLSFGYCTNFYQTSNQITSIFILFGEWPKISEIFLFFKRGIKSFQNKSDKLSNFCIFENI